MSSFDPNPDTAMEWAAELGLPPNLPKSLKDSRKRARLVNEIDGKLIAESLLANLSSEEKRGRLGMVAGSTASLMPDVGDANTRTNISLRLWAGCISAAKMISDRTLTAPNTPETRAIAFAVIDRKAQEDALYRAGVESAPAFKRLRLQEYYLEGVPAQSPVRRFESESEDRSMRLLQPKLIILYLIAKKGKVKNNKTEISKLLSYERAGWTSTQLKQLQDEGFVKTKVTRSTEYLVLTRKGRRKIAPLFIAKFLPVSMASVATIPMLLALDEIVFGLPIQPLALLITAGAILFLSAFFAYETTQLEKEYFKL